MTTASAEPRTTETIYVEVAGTTAHVAGQRGTVRGFHREGGRIVGVFVRLDAEMSGAQDGGAMLYVRTGASLGSRGQHREVLDWRVIDRDEFDQITGLADVRREMGWR